MVGNIALYLNVTNSEFSFLLFEIACFERIFNDTAIKNTLSAIKYNLVQDQVVLLPRKMSYV